MTEPRPGVDPATSTADLMLTASEEHTQHWEQRAVTAEAEADRLRADLADAQRRIATAVSIHSGVHHCVGARLYAGNGNHPPSTAIPGLCPTVAALSAGGGGQDEGDQL